MAIITLQQLKTAGACSEQRAKFRAIFGTSVEVTEELAIQHAETFSWDWAADNLLPEDAWDAYAQARALAWEAYEQVTAPAAEAYEQAVAGAFARLYIQHCEHDAFNSRVGLVLAPRGDAA